MRITPKKVTPKESDLHAEIARLNKIIHALMDRVESSSNNGGSDFNLFQTEITLENQVRRRTNELEAALRENEKITRALRESEEKLRSLYELSPLGIASTDMTGQYIEFNESFRRICGYSEEELKALDYWALTPVKYKADEARQLESLATSGRYGPYEKEYIRKDGSLVPLSLNGVLVTGHDGVKYIWSIVEDITERNKAEELLHKSFEEIEDLYNHSPCGYHSLDKDGVFCQINDTELAWLGYTREEIIGKMKWVDIITTDSQPTFQEYFAKLKQQGFVHDTEFEIIRKDGTVLLGLLNATSIYDSNGNFAKSRSTLYNITERKQTEDALNKVQLLLNETELKGKNIAIQTASAIAHEINQPLLAIATYSDAAIMLMKAAHPNYDKIFKAVEGSRKQALRAGRSIRELLEYLSVKDFSREAFDLNLELKNILSSVMMDYEYEINFTLRPDDQLPLVSANRPHVKKVLLNLINNGLDAMIKAGAPHPELTITVTSRSEVCLAQVSVQDNGPGIKPELFSKLFEPFFTTKSDGIGMGLAISRSLIEENGGQLWLDPQNAPGATFHLTLPFAE